MRLKKVLLGDLYTISQVLSLILFEKKTIFPLVAGVDSMSGDAEMSSQLNLFDDFPGH